MESRFVAHLLRLNGWRLWLLFSLAGVVATLLIVSAMDLVLNGQVTRDYVLTGLVAAGIVAPVSLLLLSTLLRELARQQQQQLAHSVALAEARLRVALDSTDEGILMLALDGRLLSANKRFFELWRLPPTLVGAGRGSELLQQVAVQLQDPEAFRADLRRLDASDAQATDALHCQDGRVFERYTQPLSVGTEQGRIWCFRDITTQAQTQQALTEREQQYRAILNQAGEGIDLVDALTLNFLEVNESACRRLGYRRDELLGQTCASVLAPSHEAAWRAALTRVGKEGQIAFESRYRCKDGTCIDVAVSTRAIRLRGRDCLVGVWHDIGERKLADEALRASRALLQAIIDTAPMRVFWKDRDLRYLGCNPAFARDAGKSHPDEIVGKDDFEMVWAEQAESYRAADRAVMESGTPILSFDEPQTTPDGHMLWLRTSKVPLRSADNQPIGILGVYEDITDRKLAEEVLREREEVFSAIVNRSVEGVLLIDAQTMAFAEFNDAACEGLGYTREEFSRLHLTDIQGQLSASETRHQCALAAATPQGQHFEDLHRCKNGDLRDRHVSHRPVEVRGRVYLATVWHDVTESKRMADTLRRREHYQRALLDNFPFMVWLKDDAGRFLAVNEVFAKTFGQPSTEALIGKTDLDIAPADLAERYRTEDRAVLDSGSPRQIEELIETEGRRTWFETYKSPVAIDGRCIGTVGFARDITERRQADWNLKMAVEVTQVVFWKIEFPGMTLVFDHADLAVLGVAVDESLSTLQDWLDRVHPDDVGQFVEQLLAVQQPGTAVFDLEYRLRQQSGACQWIHTKGRVVQRTAQGEPEVAVGTSMNITARKQIEEAARESEQRSRNLATLLRLIADNEPDMIWAKDLDKRFLFTNRAFCRQLLNAADTDEPLGKDDLFFALRERQAHPEDPQWHTFGELCVDSDAVTLQRRAPSVFEEFGHIKGRMTSLEVHKAPFFNEKGELIGTVGSARDVTERRRTENELRVSEARYQMVAEHVSDVIWLYDLSTERFTYVSPSVEKLRGFTLEEVMGQSLQETLTPASFQMVVQVLPPRLAAFAAGDPASRTQTHELDQNRKDGSVVATEVVTTLVADADGRATHIQGVTRDITERRRVEAELERHRQHLEELVEQRTTELLATEARATRILDSAADGLYGIDSQGRITFINPAACQMLGYTAEQVMGRSAHDLFHHSRPDGSPYPAAQCSARRAWKAGRASRFDDETYWHADGHPLPVSLASHPIVEKDEIVGAVVSVVDVGAQRAAAAAREQALVAAESLARARSEFLANMSHEIRTPMNGVLGFARIGLRSHADPVQARNAFEKILSSGKHLLGVVNEILDFSKIDSGKLHLEHTEMSLADVLDDALALVADRASAKGLELRLDKAADLPLRCFGDPLRLGQVLLNLLTNAVKFTSTGSVHLAAALQQGQLVFRVTDTGIGMDAEQLAGIFNPFQQADGSTTRRFGGTGLGLAICKRLLELMHGDIQVHSSPGAGSVFEVRVPYIEPASRQHTDERPPMALPDRPLAGLSILLAEDNEINQLMLESNLEHDGARLVIVGDGSAAVQRVRDDGPQAYDIVLLDIQMPVMDGYEAARRILAIAPGLPIIGQTAHAFDDDREKCLAAGMVGHIAKPIDPDALVRLVLQVLAAGHGRA